jgi:hypothetical protein
MGMRANMAWFLGMTGRERQNQLTHSSSCSEGAAFLEVTEKFSQFALEEGTIRARRPHLQRENATEEKW